ncbi:glycosyltransferase family 2 protein [Otoolea muris]|uniref:glycosyltransferase family 2 protein n=1 Tax=Otoolea muris TaxID=2941515 RepID=UPI00203C1E49|nr:glycosyltransferase family 2 protein [Otoolea muris]
MKNKKIAIILVNYCNYLLTAECIESIRKSFYTNYLIIVIDNASPDSSGEQLKDIDGIHFIQADQNQGFAYGNNLGIQYAIEKMAEYILLLNNDTIVDKRMIGELLSNADENTVTAPKIYYMNGEKTAPTLWYAGGDLDFKSLKGRHRGLGQADRGNFDQANSVTYAPGCCLLINRNIFDKVGLLDEDYFMYCEDTDFSYRLLNNNIKIQYIPSAVLWHKVSASTGREMSPLITYYVFRNRILFAQKNLNKIYIFWAYYINFIEILKAWLGRRPSTYKKYGFWGIIDAFKQDFGKSRRRLI